MKNLILMGLAVFSIVNLNAQNTFPSNGFVGIGTTSPALKLQIVGGHGDTRFGLHFAHQNAAQQADLSLWASEPGLTYSGVGIGNNVYNNAAGNGGILRISSTRGASYMRLLDGEIRMNVVKDDGSDLTAVVVSSNGDVSLGGTHIAGTKLSVNGNIRAKEIKIEATNWPDFVFNKNYNLPTLAATERYLKDKGHLPGIPSALQVNAAGVNLGDMNAKLLQKIEELTLHLINQDKQLQMIKTAYKKQQFQIKKLQKIRIKN